MESNCDRFELQEKPRKNRFFVIDWNVTVTGLEGVERHANHYEFNVARLLRSGGRPACLLVGNNWNVTGFMVRKEE